MGLKCAIGLMSGTSMDGIDIAVVETDGERIVRRGSSGFFAYDAAFRLRIERALEVARTIKDRDERPGDIANLEREITVLHADAVRAFLAAHPELRPDLIGFHGQTVFHAPDRGMTVQIGDGELLALETGLPVVWDMRANDMRHGGQGAPLVPAYHAALAASLDDENRMMPVCFVNIGGISNITFVPQEGDPIAFDSGPGNALIDQWIGLHTNMSFDADGRIAGQGMVVEDVVSEYLGSSFFTKPAPKSLDRNDFDLLHVKDLAVADGARTLAAVSARAIHAAVRLLPDEPRLWIVAGGGRKNPHIVGDLRDAVAGSAKVLMAEDVGLDGDAMEAEAWAYLAVRAQRGLPLTFPTTTGCLQPVSGGLLATP